VPGQAQPLLDAETLRELEHLSILHLGAVLHGLTGERRRTAAVRGLEFADYRPYVPGDDLRRVDWNIYARLGEAFVKTSPGEGHVAVALLIDGSASMGGATDVPPRKFSYALRFAATLAAVAVLGGDAAEGYVLDDGRARGTARMSRAGDVEPLLEALAQLRLGAGTDLPASVRAYRDRAGEPDVAVLITDAMVPSASLLEALEELARSADTAALLHVIDDRPTELAGAVELRDSETGERMLLEITPALRRRYAASVAQIEQAARACAASVGVGYVRADTAVRPLDRLAAAAGERELVAPGSARSGAPGNT
jgi:uncharacterized protein (DUF58 family)